MLRLLNWQSLGSERNHRLLVPQFIFPQSMDSTIYPLGEQRQVPACHGTVQISVVVDPFPM